MMRSAVQCSMIVWFKTKTLRAHAFNTEPGWGPDEHGCGGVGCSQWLPPEVSTCRTITVTFFTT